MTRAVRPTPSVTHVLLWWTIPRPRVRGPHGPHRIARTDIGILAAEPTHA